jgi:hypothetical protein
MPSATAKIERLATKLSSLTSRRSPVSVMAAQAIVTSVRRAAGRDAGRLPFADLLFHGAACCLVG